MTQRFFTKKASLSHGQRNPSGDHSPRLSNLQMRPLIVRMLTGHRQREAASSHAAAGTFGVGLPRVQLPRTVAAVAIASTLALCTALPGLSQSTTAFPLLNLGSAGESVSSVQAILKLMGFYQGEITGTYSPATQTAVAQFQTAAGISADGVVGQSTWQKLLPSPESVGSVNTAAAVPAPAAQPVSQSTSQTVAVAEPAAPSGPPVLRLNAEGPAVAQLQRELRDLNYYDGLIDGGFGEQTLQAVEAFQSDQQLTVDGVVGASTWDALSRALGQ